MSARRVHGFSSIMAVCLDAILPPASMAPDSRLRGNERNVGAAWFRIARAELRESVARQRVLSPLILAKAGIRSKNAALANVAMGPGDEREKMWCGRDSHPNG